MQSGDIILETPKAVWGHPSSVTLERWQVLPEPMRAEGLRMLLDMGVTDAGACRQLGLSAPDFAVLLRPQMELHKRHEPDFSVIDEAKVRKT